MAINLTRDQPRRGLQSAAIHGVATWSVVPYSETMHFELHYLQAILSLEYCVKSAEDGAFEQTRWAPVDQFWAAGQLVAQHLQHMLDLIPMDPEWTVNNGASKMIWENL